MFDAILSRIDKKDPIIEIDCGAGEFADYAFEKGYNYLYGTSATNFADLDKRLSKTSDKKVKRFFPWEKEKAVDSAPYDKTLYTWVFTDLMDINILTRLKKCKVVFATQLYIDEADLIIALDGIFDSMPDVQALGFGEDSILICSGVVH